MRNVLSEWQNELWQLVISMYVQVRVCYSSFTRVDIDMLLSSYNNTLIFYIAENSIAHCNLCLYADKKNYVIYTHKEIIYFDAKLYFACSSILYLCTQCYSKYDRSSNVYIFTEWSSWSWSQKVSHRVFHACIKYQYLQGIVAMHLHMCWDI